MFPEILKKGFEKYLLVNLRISKEDMSSIKKMYQWALAIEKRDKGITVSNKVNGYHSTINYDFKSIHEDKYSSPSIRIKSLLSDNDIVSLNPLIEAPII